MTSDLDDARAAIRDLRIAPSAVARQCLRGRRDPADPTVIVTRLWLPRWGLTVLPCRALADGWLCVEEDDPDDPGEYAQRLYVSDFDIATGIERQPHLQANELLDIWRVVADSRCGSDLDYLARALVGQALIRHDHGADPMMVRITNRAMRDQAVVLIQAGLLVFESPTDTYRLVLPMHVTNKEPT